MSTLADELLRERIRVKLKNQRDGTNDPLPEKFEFNNEVKGVVVRRVTDVSLNLYNYEVQFQLNGLPFEVKVPLTYELARAGRADALTALYKALADALVATFMEEIGRTAISP